MATRKAPTIRAGEGWTLVDLPLGAPRRRSAMVEMSDPLMGALADAGLEPVRRFEARPSAPQRRAATPAPLRLHTDASADDALVLMLRHPSGAVTFHAPQAAPVLRGRRSVVATLQFEALLRPLPPTRRGLLPSGFSDAVIGYVLRFVGKRVQPLIGKLVAAWEKREWRSRGLSEGLMRVVGNGSAFALQPAKPEASVLAAGPSLLLLHGTFSDTRGSFGKLAANGFLDQARARYGERIYAFEHYSVSKSLDDNLSMLRAALPAGEHAFDLVGYSRGALLARLLNEQAGRPEAGQATISLGQAVLVTGPHCGTPLARPERLAEAVGWLTNVLEWLPDHPLTHALSWIAEAVSWLAQRAIGSAPGLQDMNAGEATIRMLQQAGRNPDPRYAAVVADYEPDAGLAARLLDVAVDGYFGEANDLVVPTQGAWQFAAEAGAGRLPADAVLRFGPGGEAHHLNVLGHARSCEFALQRLLGNGAGQRGAATPLRGLPRRAAPAAPEPELQPAALAVAAADFVPGVEADQTFHILVLADPDKDDKARERPQQVVASYGGARVIQPYSWSNAAPRRRDGLEAIDELAGTRWRQIITMHQILLDYMAGKPGATPLTEEQLKEFGCLLFKALFTGAVGRLYDEARGRLQSRRLNLVLSSNVARWAEKPWEFACDPTRGTCLATQDIHLIRDVPFMIPADRLPPHAAPLRVLMVHAQPIDAAALSVEDERRLIERSFQPLIEAGLVELKVLARATPAMLHNEFESEFGGGSHWDVLHFVGHGVFDTAAGRGRLVFENGQGQTDALDERKLAEILAGRGLRLVFLNACETAQGREVADFTRGVAPALLRMGIPAVIANQFSVFDSSAVIFASELYDRLARGGSVAQATREARIALNYSLSGITLDWAVPVLFTRVPELRLTNGSGLAVGVAAAASPRRGARAARGLRARRQLRVGVWDVSRRFPVLGEWLQQLESVQSAIDFELVELAMPLDARAMVGSGDSPTRYLDADTARRRLHRQAQQLGVDLLVGLTHLPMMSDDTLNVYAVWGSDSPLLLFSYAGWEVPPHGPVPQHLLANALAGLVAAHSGKLQSHNDDPHCPLYYNEERDFELLVDRAAFSPPVRRALQRQDAALLAALDAILETVPRQPKATQPAAKKATRKTTARKTRRG